MSKIVRMAIIGVGGMGSKYAAMISEGLVRNMTLTGAVCRRDEVAGYIRGLSESIRIYRDADEMFDNPDDYDAVLIVTPHKIHPELAIRAFSLGKHVFCDKPAGVSIGDAKRMTVASVDANKIYAMMFHQRLYDKYISIKNILESGELGIINRIMLVNSRYFRTKHYHDSGSWRSSWNGEGGGALINQGQHILDIWQWLFGMPETIYADIPFGKYNDFSVDDEATIMMRYSNNLTAVFMLTTGEAVWEERLEIIGSKGKILLEDDNLHIYRYSEDSYEFMKKSDMNSREGLDIIEEEIIFDKKPEPYIQMLENFAEAVNADNNEHLIAKGSDAYNALLLTNAAYYSAYRHMPVSIDLSEDEYDIILDELCKRENCHE